MTLFTGGPAGAEVNMWRRHRIPFPTSGSAIRHRDVETMRPFSRSIEASLAS